MLGLSFQNILHPVVQSLSLLETAIHSRRAHIQPATAVVISSVRAALLGAHCLAKDSELLVKYPGLQKDRKIVLVELSKLVNVAKGINPGEGAEDDDDSYDPKQLESLAKSARAVFASMKRFLHKASDLGIEPVMVDENGNIDMSASETETQGDTVSGRTSPVRPTRESRIRTPTNSGNARIQEAFKLRAASISDLRAARRRASSPPPPMPNTAGLINRARSPSVVTTPVSAGFSSGSGRSSPISIRSAHERRMTNGDIEPPLPTPPLPSPRDLSTTPDVHDAISDAKDALLSVIAAFIGHIHSHHAGSHPSSHAHLIEMTKETIDTVRELLTVVEAVGRNGEIRMSKPREVDNLRMAKDNLYDVASRLVQGAEDVANMPLDEGEEDYDIAKARLMQCATGTLRAGTECVRLVKLCVPDSDVTATPRQVVEPIRHSTPRPAQDGAVILRDMVVGQRGVHTLSGLHRKASSLSLLQRRYQGDGLVTPSEEPSEEDEEDEEVVEDASQEDETVRVPASTPFPVPARSTPIRPSLLHIHTTPIPLAPKSAGLLRTFSDDLAVPRSRSTSLSSPAPIRRAHRSPSHSADLDKFTSDYSIPSKEDRQASPLSEYRLSAYTSASGTTDTTQSSSGDHQHLVPQTPDAESPPVGYVTTDVQTIGSFPRLANLFLEGTESENTPVKLRPPGPTRAVTAPVDARFWVATHDYDPREIAFNSEGAMVGASLAVLVEKMTPHDGPVDPIFWAGFFFTFRLFTTPAKLLDVVMARYDIQPPQAMSGGERDRAMWIEKKVVPVRLRIYNFLKAWLDTHWKSDTDDVVLETLRQFAANAMQRTLPAMSIRLLETIKKRSSGTTPTSRALKRISSTDKLRSHIGLTPPPSTLPPTPIISKSLNTLLQKNPTSLTIPITEFDTLELARQLTIMESKLFCAVVPELLLRTDRKGDLELKALSTLSNQITGWVADGILNEFDQKKRTTLLKFYIKLADVSAPTCCGGGLGG
jgi:son of sevenless-like protein